MGVFNCHKNNKNEYSLRFEVLKGADMHDELEHECKEACGKQMLKKVETNNKKIFIGVEQGQEKNKDNALVIFHKGKMPCCKEWTKQNYGGTCKLKGCISHESSVMFNKGKTTDSVKEDKEFLSEETKKRKKEKDHNSWH